MLYNQTGFYSAFANDMLKARKEIIIYSPFVSRYRAKRFNRQFHKLIDSGIKIIFFTRSLEDYSPSKRGVVAEVLGQYEDMGIVIYCLKGYIHEKVAIIDREILWEGSLNILSQRSSREMMRRVINKDSAEQVIRHLRLNKVLAGGQETKRTRPRELIRTSIRPKRRYILTTIVLCWALTVILWWLFISLLDIIPLKVVLMWVDTLTANTPQ